MKTCPECGIELVGVKKRNRFCSRSCSANYNNNRRKLEGWSLSKEQRLKISKSLAGKKPWSTGKEFVEREIRTCETCDKTFRVKINSTKVYCSLKCNPNMGGYREGSGRAKTGYYKGIYCGSTYELVWVIYNIDNNIEFKKFEGCLKNENLTYFPDFLIGNTIVEIKGYESKESVDRKTELAVSKGYDVKVLYREDLEKEFKWVEDNYEYREIFHLYDGYKPEYDYVCDFCGEGFSRDKKSKTKTTFCSRSCSVKGNRLKAKKFST